MNTPQTKVLVIDDAQELLRNVESWLTAQGYSPVVTSEAGEARTRLQSEEFALVLSHFAMPGLPGNEAIALAHASPSLPAVPADHRI